MSASQSRWRPGRRLVVPVVVVALLAGSALPARAFLSVLDPAAWAVVAQMAAVLSQSIAIKRQVENVRNQARAEFFGKLAPLTGKLTRVTGYIADVRSRASLPVYMPNPGMQVLVAGEPDSGLPPFNDPAPPCADDPDDPACMLPIDHSDPDTVNITPQDTADLTTTLLDSYSTPRFPGVRPPSAASRAAYAEVLETVQGQIDAAIARSDASVALAERRRLGRRAAVEAAMGVVEDWRGCQQAPEAGATLPDISVDDRLPCATNGGLGRDEPGSGRPSGTVGLQQQLAANLEALERFQDGDASKAQIDNLQTQLLLTLGRIEAARGEMEARLLDEANEDAQLAEAARRRRLALLKHELDCRTANPEVFMYARWIPTDPAGDPSVGRCHAPADRSAAALAALAASDLELR